LEARNPILVSVTSFHKKQNPLNKTSVVDRTKKTYLNIVQQAHVFIRVFKALTTLKNEKGFAFLQSKAFPWS